MKRRIVQIAYIAASIVLVLAIVLACVFWARSYQWSDRLMGPLPRSHMFQAYTWRGTCHLNISGPAYRLDLWETYSSPIPQVDGIPSESALSPGFFGFSLQETQGIWHLTAPMWFAVLAPATALVVLCRNHIRRRFSVLTLLTATTLVAVVLGLLAAVGAI